MEKEVNVFIKGIQILDGEEEPVEVICPGLYYKKGEKHYVVYEESNDSFEEPNKNTLKITPNCVEVIKRGMGASHMVFEINKKNMTYYQTPFGEMIMGISTDEIVFSEKEEQIKVEVAYGLEVNYQFVADCRICIVIQNKSKEIQL